MQTTPEKRGPNIILLFGLIGVIALIIIFTMFARSQGNSKNVQKFFDEETTEVLQNTHTAPGEGQQAGVPRISAVDHARGSSDPSVVWIEYGDFECPFCKRYHEEIQQLLAAYSDDVQVVYRHFPLDIHTNAYEKAIASECAAELGGEEAFWQYHDILFDRANANGLGISLNDLPKFAVELGINEASFVSCLDSGRHDLRIESDVRTAVAAGVTGTPATVIIDPSGAGTLVPGVIDFEQMVEVLELLGV